MTSFKEDWKAAKAAFTTSTQKKKPSASLLGMFNKGSGIQSALDSADKAKTAGELRDAMATFQKSYTEYLRTLDKAILDPKVTPIADKTAYADATKKLKAALLAIHQSANVTMQSLVDAGAKAKDKVDPADLRKKADAAKAEKDRQANAIKAENERKAEAVRIVKERLKAMATRYGPASAAIQALLKIGDDDGAGAFKSFEKALPLVKALVTQAGEYKDDAVALKLAKFLEPSLVPRTLEQWTANTAKLKPAIAIKNRAMDWQRHTGLLQLHFVDLAK